MKRLLRIENLSQWLLCMLFGAGLLLLATAVAAESLQADDCQKCHRTQIEEIQTSGGQHRDRVRCIDCHLEHPPKGDNAIPACGMCHPTSGDRHFSSPNCLDCHRPHSPLQIDFSKTTLVRPACITCHPGQGEELSEYPSNHSVLDCKECHRQHGKYLSCLECHDPHIEGQTYADCRSCHRPHSPLKVAYENNLQPAACVVCHEQPGALLAENKTKHGRFLCVYCHKFQHKQIPACRTCHGEPHFGGLHQHFEACIDCHVGPHDLVN